MIQTTTNKRAAYVLKGVHCPNCLNPLKVDTLFPDAVFGGFASEPGFCQCTIWHQSVILILTHLEQDRVTESGFQRWADEHRGRNAALLISANNKNEPLRISSTTMAYPLGTDRIRLKLKTGGHIEWRYDNEQLRDTDYERIGKQLPHFYHLPVLPAPVVRSGMRA